MKLLLVALVAIVVMLQLPEEGSAVCCTKASGINRCWDCTRGTPCCAHGRCNIFCCNCDGGCRQGSCHGKREIAHPMLRLRRDADNLVASADADGDGRMSLEEAREYLAHRNLPEERVKRSLQDLDLDGDSFLSQWEIDPDYR